MELLVDAVAGMVLLIVTAVEPAATVTEVVADAVLLAGLGSGSLPLTVALLVMLPPVAGAVALIVTEALAPLASEQIGRATCRERVVQVAGAEVDETKVAQAAGASVTVTP